MKEYNVNKEEWTHLLDEYTKVFKQLRNSGYDLSKIYICVKSD